jgi:DNA-binding GntR family transcriptional regulator
VARQAAHKRAAEDSLKSLDSFQGAVRRVIDKGDTRSSLVTQIACVVGAEILTGQREPGSDLNSVELARRFKTSRTPTREALILLEKEGLVEIMPRRRPRVSALSLPEIREIYRVRAAFLGMVAAEAAVNATDDEIESLRVLFGEMQRAARCDDSSSYYWSNVWFHDRLTELAHNRTLKRILETLVLRSLRLRRLTLSDPDRIKRSLTDHSHLVTALQDRDQELAASLAKANVLGALKILERNLAGEP